MHILRVLLHGVRSGDQMATFQVATPSSFNFAKPEEWPKWLKRFERFHQASELCKKSEESQVNTLLYSMGEKADDILQSFNLEVEELKKYDTVVAQFQKHFISRRNVIFERAKFNSRKQEEGETADSFKQLCMGWQNTVDSDNCTTN